MVAKVNCNICNFPGQDPSRIGWIARDMPCPYCGGTGKVSACKCEICGKADGSPGQMFYAHDKCVEKASGKPVKPLEERRKENARR